MDKAPDAFRTISEVAEELDIPQHVLRFWETRFAQIKPMKRSGGRRYYRPDDVDLHGNTSAASIPLALAVAVKDGRVKKGDLVLFEAMGGGFTWGSALVRW